MSENVSLLDLIEQAIASLEVALPARNQTAVQLQGVLAADGYEIQDILDIIESDQALTAEVLRVANSPFYSGLTEITTVQNAVVRIGGPEVVRLAIAATEKKTYQVKEPSLGVFMAPLWDHAMGVALGARWLARKLGFRELENEAFIGGLLHDVGKLLLIRVCDDLMASGRVGRDIPDAVIHEILDQGHCRHGAALLEHWGLPDTYRELVLHHHDEQLDDRNVLLLLVRLADLACRSLGVGMNQDSSVNLSATEEAHALDASDLVLAELSIMLEDSFALI
jgi:putative nucleotidyltransferase with HDIG domain